MLETIALLGGTAVVYPQAPLVAVLGVVLYVLWSFFSIVQSGVLAGFAVALVYGVADALRTKSPETYANLVAKYPATIGQIDARLMSIPDYSFHKAASWLLGFPGAAPPPTTANRVNWTMRGSADIVLHLIGFRALVDLVPVWR